MELQLRSRILPAVLSVLLICGSVRAADQVLDFSAPPKPGVWQTADFRIWIPENVKTIRGVLINFHGSSGDARAIVEQQLWRDAARQWNFALLGMKFSNGRNVDYRDPQRGSGDAILSALAGFARKSGHPEIAHAPWCLWGVSLGGASAWAFAAWNPQRTIAFAAVNGTGRAQVPDAMLKVPGLVFEGELDTAVKPESVAAAFDSNRAKGALWALVMHWGLGHDSGNSNALIVPFFDQVIQARLPNDQSAERSPVKLIDLPETDGFLGGRDAWASTFATIAPFKNHQGDKTKASWLPNEPLAYLWRAEVAKSPPIRMKTKWDQTGDMWTFVVSAEGDLPKDIETLEFFDANRLLGSTNTAPFSIAADNVSSGIHSVLAIATLKTGRKITSPPLLIVAGSTYPYTPKP